jgi:uncharacterized protein (TIGR00369 family)
MSKEQSVSATDFTALSGLELMRWIQSVRPAEADMPSIGRLLGMRFDEVGHGRIVVSLDTRPDFANPLGAVHGGIAATLLDSVMGCAVHTTLPAGVAYTTLELKVNYIRAAHTGGQTLIAEGERHPRRPPHRHGGRQGPGRPGETDRPRHHDLPHPRERLRTPPP